jgi:hypothetical protein
MFSTLDKDIEALISLVTHVSAGLLQSNKALFKETGTIGEKHLLATPSSAVRKRALLAFQLQLSAFVKATFVVKYTITTKGCSKTGLGYLYPVVIIRMPYMFGLNQTMMN